MRAIPAEVIELLRARFATILTHPHERATGLLLGGGARSLGHGGIVAVAGASGAARSRVQHGVNELDAGTATLPGVRKPGVDRKALTGKDPGLVLALLALVDSTRRGDREPRCDGRRPPRRNWPRSLPDRDAGRGRKVWRNCPGRRLRPADQHEDP